MAYPLNRQPTVSSDDAARDQIRAFVERILRMKEEAKAINDDIREIYAEAKGNGFDKTVLGQVVSFVEKRAKDPATLAERSALFDLYVVAFDGGDEADDETGTSIALPHTHEVVDHDPVTGEIIEQSSRAKAAHVASRGEDAVERQHSSNPGIAGADEPGRQTSASADADPAPIHEPAHELRQLGGEGGKNAPALSVDTNEAEHSTVSSADFQREPLSVPEVSDSSRDADAQRSTESINSNSDALPVSEDEGSNTALKAETVAENETVAATNSETHHGEAGESPAPASEPTAEEGGAGASASSVVPRKLKMNREFFDAPHPSCKRPSFCGGNSNLALCDTCKAAPANSNISDEIEVVAAGNRIAHRGVVQS